VETIGEKIKRLRTEKRLTQKQVSELCGLTPSAYLFIENGTTKSISIDVGIGIARALEIPFVELFDIEDHGNIKLIEDLKKRISHLERDLFYCKRGILSSVIHAYTSTINGNILLRSKFQNQDDKDIFSYTIVQIIKNWSNQIKIDIDEGYYSLEEYKQFVKDVKRANPEANVIDLTYNVLVYKSESELFELVRNSNWPPDNI